MAANAPIHCSVITPERQVLDANAKSVVLPAHDGLRGVLKDHAPLLCELGTGVLRVDTENEGSKEFFVDRGFAQVLSNEVTILTEHAGSADEVSRADAEKALAEAEKMPMTDDASREARQRALDVAKAKLHIARK